MIASDNYNEIISYLPIVDLWNALFVSTDFNIISTKIIRGLFVDATQLRVIWIQSCRNFPIIYVHGSTKYINLVCLKKYGYVLETVSNDDCVYRVRFNDTLEERLLYTAPEWYSTTEKIDTTTNAGFYVKDYPIHTSGKLHVPLTTIVTIYSDGYVELYSCGWNHKTMYKYTTIEILCMHNMKTCVCSADKVIIDDLYIVDNSTCNMHTVDVYIRDNPFWYNSRIKAMYNFRAKIYVDDASDKTSILRHFEILSTKKYPHTQEYTNDTIDEIIEDCYKN